MKNITDRRNEEYIPLIESFKKEVEGLNLQGIIGPHFPGIGECYENACYKFAFCGWETYYWNSMKDFMKLDPLDYLMGPGVDDCSDIDYISSDYSLNKYKPLEWPHNWHTTFWAFVIKFLAKFYKTDFDQLVNDKENANICSILKSFVWGNSNAIERFEVSSKWEGAEFTSWEAVKSASRKIDDLNHIINSCAPKVVFLLYSCADEKYIVNKTTLSSIFGHHFEQKRNVLMLKNEDMNYMYYYLRDSSTHVFHLPHPRWMGQFSGHKIEGYVDSLIKDIENYNIWDTLPNSCEDWKADTNSVDEKDSSYYKPELIASIARSLTQKNVVMYGGDLARLFNMNEIRRHNGEVYSEEGGRGIFKVISSAWAYYHNRGDYQTAYEIARSFVNKDGEYPYY